MANTITTSTNLFGPELVSQVFSKVKGHSALAKLSAQNPIPFAGTDTMIFTMDGEAAIVGEGSSKPAGEAKYSHKVIKPIKFVYQHRLTDEFIRMAEEKQLPYLNDFVDGFAKKMARALDISAFHGVNPADGTTSATVGTNHFDSEVTTTVTYDGAKPDDCIDSAVAPIQNADGNVTGIVMTPSMGADIGKMKTGSEHVSMYPEFRFGQNPSAFAGMLSDINSTLAFGSSLDRAIVGDFAGAFRWGYADNIPLEVIQYGDPDGLGDLKKNNQIVLRAEAYIGWGILDATSFTRIVATEPTAGD